MNPMAITTEALKVTPKDIEENLAKIGGNEDLHESQFFRWMLNNHFKHVYKQEGRNVLINSLNEWLEQWEIEQGGQDNVMYEVDERSDVERIEYVLHITKKIMFMDIQENQTLLDTPITDVLPAPLEPMLIQPENFDLFQDLQQTETWDAVVREFVIIDSQENILNYYAAYQALIKEEDRLAKKRKDMLKKFVKEVNTWSHMRFAQPKNNRKSTQGYLTAKYTQLKALMPNNQISRTILNKMKKEDTWVNHTPKSEVALSRGGGICNTRTNILNEQKERSFGTIFSNDPKVNIANQI